jgi:uncharacterized protein YegP (UPF0339 family)
MAAKRRYVVFKDAKQEWRWRYYAPNNKIIASSGEGYKNRGDCLNAIKLLKRSFFSAVEVR